MDNVQRQFKRITVQGWRQFDCVVIDLHESVTIITGANGSGKSSLLRIFSRHFGFDRPYLSAPILVNGEYKYTYGIFASVSGMARRIAQFFGKADHNGPKVGELEYTDGQKTSLTITGVPSVAFQLNLPHQQSVEGLHVDSHQSVSQYQAVGNIPATMLTAQQIYANYNGEVSQRYHGGYGGSSPLYRMKESIVAMAVFGEGNSRSAGNPALLSALDGFIETLKKVLPKSLGFFDLVVRGPEVVIRTYTGEFLLDAASGGVATLFDIAFRLYMYSIGKEKFVVTMDEPENHLHPSMQRSLMPRLVNAFPKAQFIIATHSPFIVSSVRDSAVYVLRYESASNREIDGLTSQTTADRVVSQKLDTITRSSSANEILREVLGVEATTPEWVTDSVQSIVAKYSGRSKIDAGLISELRSELEGLGYESQYPAALAQLVKGK